MATAEWAAPSTRSSNIASTTLDSIANGSTSAFVTYDNSSVRDFYAAVTIKLGSFTSTTGASITLRVYATDGTDTPDNTGSVGGGETYTVPITVGASAKVAVIPMVRLYPFSMRLQVTNNGGATTAASGNEMYVTPFGESIA
jgi:hypothetical protein